MAAMAAILDTESSQFEEPCIYWLPRCSIPNFSSIRQAVLEKKSKIAFQDGHHGGHIGNRIGTIWTTVNLLIAPKVHTKFGVNLLSGSGEEVENAKSLTDGQTTDNAPRYNLSWAYRPRWAHNKRENTFSYFICIQNWYTSMVWVIGTL